MTTFPKTPAELRDAIAAPKRNVLGYKAPFDASRPNDETLFAIKADGTVYTSTHSRDSLFDRAGARCWVEYIGMNAQQIHDTYEYIGQYAPLIGV
jgi:hypothetical protein